MTVYLGVDGGGSTCRARAVDQNGRIIGQGLAGPANITSDFDGARGAILSACRAALGGTGDGDVCAVLGLAGANDPVAAARLESALPFRTCRVVTDGHISVVGALGKADGIVAAVGTGSIFIRQLAGAQVEIGGKGLILGDESSAAWIGRQLMSRALRGLDGIEPFSPLCREVIGEFGGASGVIAFAANACPADFARFAPRVTESSDPAALQIRQTAIADCARTVEVLQEGRDLPVVWVGGLGPFFQSAIGIRWKSVQPLGSALDGAMFLAKQTEG